MRDYAVLMLLSRLGLRANEIVLLKLDDVNWHAGSLNIRGKGRTLFVSTLAPHSNFSSSAGISGIAASALNRAKVTLERKGAHVFRHSLAINLLQAGATLAEIGQVLRHKSHDTTRIYAKVDIGGLRALAMPGVYTMNAFCQTLHEYVALRRSLGHKFTQPARDLEGFVTFLMHCNTKFITTKLALEWATQSPGKNASWAIKLSYVRGLARHLQITDTRTEVPAVGLLSYNSSAKPYIYSVAEIQALLEAALALKPAKA
jgi:site-specific recombinase XerD